MELYPNSQKFGESVILVEVGDGGVSLCVHSNTHGIHRTVQVQRLVIFLEDVEHNIQNSPKSIP